jgi:cold shock CspA family protein/ribosome-associated translation inhibitor RaiA
MQLPLQITYRNVPQSDAVEAKIRKRAEKLDKLFGRIMSCRVAVESPERRHRQGKRYQVRIDLTVPGAELVANREPDEHHAYEDIYVAIRDSFDAIERKLLEYVDQLQGEVKQAVKAPHAWVRELDQEKGFGFIETQEGRRVYFHMNSVLNNAFDRLKVGTEVRFTEEQGEKGPQASTVDLIGKEGRHEHGF